MNDKCHICPSCGSRRLRAITKRGMYYCPKCRKKFAIVEEAIDVCYKCDRELIDPDKEGEFMANGKWKCRRCRGTTRKEVIRHG